MKTIGTLSLGLLMSSTALSQSAVTSTKTASTLPSILKDVSLNVSPYTETKWDIINGDTSKAYDYTQHSIAASKPVTDKLTVGVEQIFFKEAAINEYEAANPVLSAKAKIFKSGIYSLSSAIEYAPKLDGDQAVTEFNLYNKVGDTMTTAIGSLSLGGELRTKYKYQTDISELADMGYYNRLTVSAFLAPKAVKGLGIYAASQIYRSVKKNTGELSSDPRSMIDVSYSVNKKLSVNGTLIQFINPSDALETRGVAAALGMNYKVL